MSNIAKTKEAQTDEDFGIGYEEAFQQLKELEILEESERLKQEVKLLPQFAGFVPESITLEGFRDLIGKMTPNILFHRTKVRLLPKWLYQRLCFGYIMVMKKHFNN
eukprot:TRINITY_DN2698_c1_g1_i2.p1 TRINITY_DN2698_c1_g1~~TRINITY_DN2698_c1_g1_i2.p1  ORF type:complete len:106 (-),score=30.92 TRINITY_DN2698_c1_g1_i2:76-393(-)